MQGSRVNTYKWINAEGKAILVKYHWEPLQSIRNLTQDEAEKIQSKNFNHATKDLYEAIENGDYPEWELAVQWMSDDNILSSISIYLTIRNFGTLTYSLCFRWVKWF